MPLGKPHLPRVIVDHHIRRTQDEDARIVSVMAYRPDPAELHRPLTKDDLARRRRALAMLSVHSDRDTYREAYERCKMNGDSLPRASAIQELVTVWKQLWESRRRG